MKTALLFVFFALALVAFRILPTTDSNKQHPIVMQITQGDSLTQVTVMGQVKNIKKRLPEATIEVVCHGDALHMLMTSKSLVADQLGKLTSEQVRFLACENTMARKKIAKEDLLKEAETIPSALVHIVLRQEEGWSYVKGGH